MTKPNPTALLRMVRVLYSPPQSATGIMPKRRRNGTRRAEGTASAVTSRGAAMRRFAGHIRATSGLALRRAALTEK